MILLLVRNLRLKVRYQVSKNSLTDLKCEHNIKIKAKNMIDK